MPSLTLSHVFYDKYALASSNVQRHCCLASRRCRRQQSEQDMSVSPNGKRIVIVGGTAPREQTCHV
jgi:hypothetical protein